jgi:hypothetical protein
MDDDLPSLADFPYIIVVDPSGPVKCSPFHSLDQALNTARGLEREGVIIRSINSGTEILEGIKLRAALGTPPERPSLFV